MVAVCHAGQSEECDSEDAADYKCNDTDSAECLCTLADLWLTGSLQSFEPFFFFVEVVRHNCKDLCVNFVLLW